MDSLNQFFEEAFQKIKLMNILPLVVVRKLNWNQITRRRIALIIKTLTIYLGRTSEVYSSLPP